MTGDYRVYTTSSGQRISFSIFGDRSLSNPCFYFHGFPGSAKEAEIAESAASQSGISIIAVERPGFGDTPFNPTHSISGWPAVIEELADHLEIGKFAVLAVSGGTPYALSTAAKMPSRVTIVAIVSGIGPSDPSIPKSQMTVLNRTLLYLSANFPLFAQLLGTGLAIVWRTWPPVMIWWFQKILAGKDLELLLRRDVQQLLSENVRRALKQTVHGAAHELVLMGQSWGFEIESIQTPVLLWHGTKDRYVPIEFSKFTVRKLKHGVLFEIPEAGHFMIVDLIGDVLQRLKAQ